MTSDIGHSVPIEVTGGHHVPDSGFAPYGFTGGGFLNGFFGFGKGFDRYNGWTAVRGWRPQLRLHQAGSEDGRLFDRAVTYLRDVGREDRRFFLFLHTYFVHDYYGVDEDEELKPCVLGRLLDALDETGLAESTLFFVLSDHGEGFEPERGRIHHGGRLHEDVIRIPLLVAGPHLSHRFVEENVSLVDVVPTLVELLGLATKEAFDGASFANSLYGEEHPRTSPRRSLYAMEHAYRWVDGARVDFRTPKEGPASYAVIYENLYYIRQGDGEEIYDMRSDPEQRRNLASSSLDLAPFRRAVEARARFKGTGDETQIDKDLEDCLRSLGYIQ